MRARVGDIVEIMSIDDHRVNNEKYVIGAKYRVIGVFDTFVVVNNPHIQRKESFLQEGQYLVYKRPIKNWIKSIFSKNTDSDK